MAEKYPEYRKRQAITPAASPTGMEQAVAPIKQAFDKAAADLSKWASDRSQELAFDRGVTAGKTPGRKLGPAIFAADRTFNQAYREESSKVLAAEANKLMNNISYEFGKIPHPSGQHIEQYQKTAQEGLGSLLGKADPKVKGQLKRAFGQKFDSIMLQLSEKVDRANKDRLTDIYKISKRDNLDNVYSYYSTGQIEAARETESEQIANINSAYENGLITKDQKDKDKKALEISVHAAREEAEMMEAYEIGGELAAEKYLKIFQEEKRGVINDAMKREIMPQLLSKLSNTIRLNSMQDELLLQSAQIEMASSPNGILSEESMDGAHDQMSEKAFNHLHLMQKNAQAKQVQTTNDINFLQNRNISSIQKSLMPTKQKDEAYKSIVSSYENDLGRPLTINEKGALVQRLGTPIKAFQNELAAYMDSPNMEHNKEGAETLSAIHDRAPFLLKGMDSEAEKKGIALAYQYDAGVGAEVAGERVNAQMAKMKDKTEIIKEEMYEKERGLEYEDSIDEKEKVAKILSVSKKILTEEALFDFRIHESNGFFALGTMDNAKEYAMKKMNEVWSTTKVNGYKEYMKNAPDRNYPELLVRFKMLTDMESLTAKINDDQDTVYKYKIQDYGEEYYKELEERPLGEKISLGHLKETLFPKSKLIDKSIRAKRYDNEGNEIDEGTFIIVPYNATMRGIPGSGQTYIWKFKPDGGKAKTNVTDTTGYMPATFNISNELLEKEMKVTPDEMREISESSKEITQAIKDIKETTTWASPYLVPKYLWKKIFKNYLPERIKDREAEMKRKILGIKRKEGQ